MKYEHPIVHPRRCVAVLLLLSSGAALGQVTLSLASGTAIPGGTVSLALTVNSGVPSQVAGLLWTFDFAPTEITAVSVIAGPAAGAAGKDVSCAGTLGRYTCVAAGINANVILSGMVAYANFTLSSAASGSFSISISGASGARPAADPLHVTASGGAIVLTAPLVVHALVCTPTVLPAAGDTSCTVTLNGPAGVGGAMVYLSSSGVSTPTTILVTAGASSATFTATAGQFTGDGTATVTASLNGSSQTAALQLIAAPVLTALNCTPASLAPGGSAICTVTINKAGPATASLAGTLITVPAAVSVAAGATSGTFMATAGQFTADGSAMITASLNGSTQTASLQLVAPPKLASLKCEPQRVPLGGNSSCTVTLAQKAVANTTVSVTASDANLISVPSSVVVAQGALSASFRPIAGAMPGQVIIVASSGASSKTEMLQVVQKKSLQSLSCSGSIVGTGGTPCVVTLTEPAPAEGLSLALTSDTAAVVMLSSIQVSGGATTASFNLRGQTLLDQDHDATIMASAGGSLEQTRVPLVGVRPVSLTCVPRIVRGGGRTTCAIWLNSGVIPDAVPLELTAPSAQLQFPVGISSRPNQASLTFELWADARASQGTATVRARFGRTVVAETVTIEPGNGPVLMLPASEAGPAEKALKFQVQAEDPLGLPVSIRSAALPEGASFDAALGWFTWTPQKSQEGRYEVSFEARNSAGAATSGKVSLHVYSGMPVIEAVMNAASQSTDFVCSAGAAARLIGHGFGAVRLSAAGAPPLDVLAVTDDRVDFMCPQLPAGATFRVKVESDRGTADSETVILRPAAPGLFSLDGSGTGPGWITVGATDQFATPRSYKAAGQPAQPGDVIVIRATGLNSSFRTVVHLGDHMLAPKSIIPAADGAWAVSIEVPAALEFGDAVPVFLELFADPGQAFRSNTVTMAVERPNI